MSNFSVTTDPDDPPILIAVTSYTSANPKSPIPFTKLIVDVLVTEVLVATAPRGFLEYAYT